MFRFIKCHEEERLAEQDIRTQLYPTFSSAIRYYFFDWAGATIDRNPHELVPKLDAEGRSIASGCLSMGMQ